MQVKKGDRSCGNVYHIKYQHSLHFIDLQFTILQFTIYISQLYVKCIGRELFKISQLKKKDLFGFGVDV